MVDSDDIVREMAELAGIRLGYRSAFGEEVSSPLETIRALLARLGFPSDTTAEAKESLTILRGRNQRAVPPIVVCRDGVSTDIAVTAVAVCDWSLITESGVSHRGRSDGGRIALPALEAGYHLLSIGAGDAELRTTIIAAPERCWRPATEARRWGLSGSVYGFRQDGDLGIGDLGHVGAMAAAAGDRGASFLGLSPLHALFPFDRGRISPYSPSSRLFIDPIYIDPRKVPGAEVTDSDAGDGLVDYERVWRIKRPLLESAWRAQMKSGFSPEFDAFRAERGDVLTLHALFDALTERDPEHRPGGGLKEAPQGDERADIEAALGERISFYCWLQWVADQQLAAADMEARSRGMDIGLLADLAVGASPDGSELWSQPGEFLSGVTVGAPPDLLAPQGQEWGLRAFNPIALEENGMMAFRNLVAAAMRHCGGVRIDHAFQFRRLFLVPEGSSAADGAYLRYPLEAFLAVLRVESNRARCMVIGEDLGTKPPDFSATLSASGVLGYRVLYFERGADNAFIAPNDYEPDTMAVLNTHDLATFKGWWLGQDIADRVNYGVTNAEQAKDATAERQADRGRLLALLRREGLVAEGDYPEEVPAEIAAHLLARCRSFLVSLSIDDVAGVVDQQNVPGVTDGAPNWRRRLPLTVEEMARPGGPLDFFAQAMAAEGRGIPSPRPEK